MTAQPLRVLWTSEGIILPSGRLCTDVGDIDEPCVLEMVTETGRPVTITITRADPGTASPKARHTSLPHTCTRWCTPPHHAELHAYGGGTAASDVRTAEQRDALVLGRAVERIVPVLTTDRPLTVVALVFFHGGEL